jgi:uncharacterized protein (TIGR00661 family)
MSRYIFVVQGEGRGHLTQAIALHEILTNAGHQVVAVLVGSTNGREIPAFFKEKVQSDLRTFESPSLVYGKGKSVQLFQTIFKQLLRFKAYWDSTKTLHKAVEAHQPDVIINFYDMVCGFYYLRFRSKIPCVCIGHQYLLLNKHFKTIKGKVIERFLLNANTKLTKVGATKLLGLSFAPLPNDGFNKVVPPLLRQEVKTLETHSDPFILAYTTHHRLSEDIIAWHEANPSQKIHCFWDNKETQEVWQYSPNLSFHRINAPKYLDMMRTCSGLASTAGFESVCEAMYLGKPTMMVPVPNHIEQQINAFDGQRAGAGIAAESFDFSKFIQYLPHHKDIKNDFRNWQNQTSEVFLKEIEAVVQPKIQETYRFNQPSIRKSIFKKKLPHWQ